MTTKRELPVLPKFAEWILNDQGEPTGIRSELGIHAVLLTPDQAMARKKQIAVDIFALALTGGTGISGLSSTGRGGARLRIAVNTALIEEYLSRPPKSEADVFRSRLPKLPTNG